MQFLSQLVTLEPALLNRIEATARIVNAPYLPLTVENIGLGPRGLPALSICHYGKQNGDPMRDPEMCFEVEVKDGFAVSFHPYYFRNDYVGHEEFAVHDGEINSRMVRKQQDFASTWSRNLIEQGFLDAFRQTLISMQVSQNTDPDALSK